MQNTAANPLPIVLADILPSPPNIRIPAHELPPVWQILVAGSFLSIAVFLLARTLLHKKRSRIAVVGVFIVALICLTATIIVARYVFHQSSSYQKEIQKRRAEIRSSH
ncbi:MAG: hypothetical protein R3C59_10270 [Planctomycetaceae bacterium]